MKLHALLLSGCVSLVGCQSAEFVQPTGADVVAPATSFSALKTVDVDLPSSTRIAINQYSQSLTYAGIDSPVAAYKVPADQGKLSFEFTSEILDEVFVPYVKIFDEQGTLLAYLDHNKFQYEKPRLQWGNRFEAEFEYTPARDLNNIIVVVYTDKSELGKYTEVIHPARLDAEARGNYLPEVKDIPIPHSLEGIVELDVSASGVLEEVQDPVIESAKKPVKVVPETQQYYHNAIKSAVEANELDRALALLEEAKALNVEGAQEVFIKAVNAK